MYPNSSYRPTPARLLPNVGETIIWQTILKLVEEENKERRRVVLFTDGSTESQFFNDRLRHINAHKIDAPYEPKSGWITAAIRADDTMAISLPMYVGGCGIDLGAFETLIFLSCPVTYEELVQGAARIARNFRPDDLSFKKWFGVVDSNPYHNDAAARHTNIEWLSRHMQEIYGMRYQMIRLDTSGEYRG